MKLNHYCRIHEHIITIKNTSKYILSFHNLLEFLIKDVRYICVYITYVICFSLFLLLLFFFILNFMIKILFYYNFFYCERWFNVCDLDNNNNNYHMNIYILIY